MRMEFIVFENRLEPSHVVTLASAPRSRTQLSDVTMSIVDVSVCVAHGCNLILITSSQVAIPPFESASCAT